MVKEIALSIFLGGCAHTGMDAALDVDPSTGQVSNSAGLWYSIGRCAAYTGVWTTYKESGPYLGVGCSFSFDELRTKDGRKGAGARRGQGRRPTRQSR